MEFLPERVLEFEAVELIMRLIESVRRQTLKLISRPTGRPLSLKYDRICAS